jgi:hypothetical protein
MTLTALPMIEALHETLALKPADDIEMVKEIHTALDARRQRIVISESAGPVDGLLSEPQTLEVSCGARFRASNCKRRFVQVIASDQRGHLALYGARRSFRLPDAGLVGPPVRHLIRASNCKPSDHPQGGSLRRGVSEYPEPGGALDTGECPKSLSFGTRFSCRN